MSAGHDVIVAGGGMAGVTAAVAAARLGARTLLLERNHCLGGAATMRNVLTWCGLYTLGAERTRVVRGLADEVLARQQALGGLGPVMAFRGVFVPFDPETLKIALDALAVAAGVDIRFGATVLAASREGGRMTAVTVAHHGGVETLPGAAFGGASTRYGNADGVNLGTLGCRFGGIPASVPLTVDDVTGAIAAQGFEPGQVTKDRCVVVRLPGSADLVLYLASEDYDPRDPAALSRAEIGARRQAWNYLQAVRAIPGCGAAYLVATGPEIGTRESRHLNGRRQFTWADIAARRRFDDGIALGAWGAEWHDRATFRSDFDYPAGKQCYQIPLSCLHSVDTDNLFCAGRLADGDRRGGAAIRVMGTAMATGQAAGTAAALTADRRFSGLAVAAALRAAGALISADDL
jgi:glycine/D-amino acid oxidase-like deaminating enzyme